MRKSTIVAGIALAAALSLAGSGAARCAAPDEPGPSRTISIDIKDADLSRALALLADETGISIAMPFSVEGKVTAHLHDVTLPAALTALLGAFDLTWRVDRNGVYIVCRPGEALAVRSPGPEEDEPAESNLIVEKIPLKYTDPYWIYSLLKGDETRNSFGIGSLSIIPNPWDNSLLARPGGPNILTFGSPGGSGSWTDPNEPGGGPIGPGSGPGSDPGTGGGGGGTQ